MQPNTKAKITIRCILPHPDHDVYFAWKQVGPFYTIKQANEYLERLGFGKAEALKEHIAIADKAEEFIRTAIGLGLPVPVGTTVKIQGGNELTVARFSYDFYNEELVLFCQLDHSKKGVKFNY